MNNKKGFTLLEVIVVIAILTVIGSFGLFMSMDNMWGDLFRNDRDMVVSALQRARSLAVNNMCFGPVASDPSLCLQPDYCCEGKKHGVHFDPTKREVVIFQGEDYEEGNSNNETLTFASHTVYIFGTVPQNVIFDRISGNVVDAPVNITLKDDNGHSSAIKVSAEGQIDF